jgi:hypothetical protein
LLAVADGDVLEIEISKTHSNIFFEFWLHKDRNRRGTSTIICIKESLCKHVSRTLQEKTICRAPPPGKTEGSEMEIAKKDWEYDAVLVGVCSGKVSFDQTCNVYDLDWMDSIREKGF